MDYSQSPQLCRALQLRVRRPCWPCSPPGCRAQPLDFWHLPEKRTVVCTGFPLPLIWSRGAPNKPAGTVLCAACNGLVTALNFTELDQSCLECDRNGQASCTAPRAALAQCRDLLTQPRSLQQHTHTPRLWTFLPPPPRHLHLPAARFLLLLWTGPVLPSAWLVLPQGRYGKIGAKSSLF